MDGVGETGKRGLIGLVTHVPFGDPQQPGMAESPGAAGHAREAEIGGVGEHGGHQGSRVVRWRAGSQMHETIGEARPAVDFREKLGDSKTRQHGVEAAGDRVGRFVLRLRMGLIDRPSSVSEASGNSPAAVSASTSRSRVSRRLVFVVAPVLETIGDGEAQLVRLAPVLERVARQQKVVEGAESAAAFDPNVARLQPFAQRHHDRDLIGPAIGSGVGLDELAPDRPQKARRRTRRKFLRAARMKLAHHVERREQRIVAPSTIGRRKRRG